MDDSWEATNTLLSDLRTIAKAKEGKLAEQLTDAVTELEGLIAAGAYDALELRFSELVPQVAEAFRKWSRRQSRAPVYERLIAEKPEFLEKKESGHYKVKPAVVRSFLEDKGCDLTRVDDADIRRARRNAADTQSTYQRALAAAIREYSTPK